jgi:serine/threonine protein kinase
MALSPGTRLGGYGIVSPLGPGGMGEVYRARDTQLERDVVLKTLPDGVASNEERLAQQSVDHDFNRRRHAARMAPQRQGIVLCA